jgi:isopentenyl-diphosphate delta-isomerase
MAQDEYLSIVNDAGIEIGKELRSLVYKNGMHNYRVVNIFITNSNHEVLIQKRTMDRKLFPGRFDFTCGEHVNYGESYESAAIRGLSEELGIRCNLEHVLTLTPKDGVSSYQGVFIGKKESDFNPDRSEGVEYLRFMSISEIERLISENKDQFKPDFPVTFIKCKKYF